MNLVINDDNLTINEIEDFSSKVRAIFVNERNEILVANYGGVYLLPGGKIEEGETIEKAIEREIKEELGQAYKENDFLYFLCLDYFQKNYPKRNGKNCNRLVQTHYFIGKLKDEYFQEQELSSKEKQDKFRLEFISLEQLESIILNNQNDNPRNIYFQKEVLTILNFYFKHISFENNISRIRKK